MTADILKPVAVLIAWSLVMLVWTIVVRMPAMKKAGIDINKVVGSKPGGLDGLIDQKAQWSAHNYMHLMEQPTLFYAVTLLLAVTGMGNGLNASIAWGYVILRILHSILQATVNIIRYRFLLFALSTLCLMALSLHALIGVFSGGSEAGHARRNSPAGRRARAVDDGHVGLALRHPPPRHGSREDRCKNYGRLDGAFAPR